MIFHGLCSPFVHLFLRNKNILPAPIRSLQFRSNQFDSRGVDRISSDEYDEYYRNYTALSFFKFCDIPDAVVDEIVLSYTSAINTVLPNGTARGTLIVACEGINGQFCIPSEQVNSFKDTILAVLLRANLGNCVDFNVGETLQYPLITNHRAAFSRPEGRPFPFRKLIVRRKCNILSDGSLKQRGIGLDLNDCGPELAPAEWHNRLLQIQRNESKLKPIVIDCRNIYESQIGAFKGALALETNSFSDSWKKLETVLAEQPKDVPLLTYCTGGIRCVKVNAYLKQRLGFQSVERLRQGIIGYEQWLQQTDRKEETLFEGENFLFDRRRIDANYTLDELFDNRGSNVSHGGSKL